MYNLLQRIYSYINLRTHILKLHLVYIFDFHLVLCKYFYMVLCDALKLCPGCFGHFKYRFKLDERYRSQGKKTGNEKNIKGNRKRYKKGMKR